MQDLIALVQRLVIANERLLWLAENRACPHCFPGRIPPIANPTGPVPPVTEPPNPPQPKMKSRKEAAAYLLVSERTVSRWRKGGMLPFLLSEDGKAVYTIEALRRRYEDYWGKAPAGS